MKLSVALIAAVAADDKKVPPRHPLQRLNRLTEFSAEILDDWFGFVPSVTAWKNKFANNAARMERNFNRGNQRCGFYDADQLPHGGPSDDRKRRSDDESEIRYNREDPSDGIKQITTGYRKWAERYLSQCSGQRQYQYQVDRMNKWNEILQAKLEGVDLPDGPDPEVEDAILATCSSWNYADASCSFDMTGANDIEVNTKYSRSACTKDETFGLTEDGKIWVSDGCRAQFRVLKTTFRKVKTAISCEWSNQVKAQGSQIAYPQCANGETINIKKATYGRWSQEVCKRPDGRHMGACNGEADHTDAVRQECNGEEDCVYHGNNQVAGDPCRGVTKYTVIKYTCE